MFKTKRLTYISRRICAHLFAGIESRTRPHSTLPLRVVTLMWSSYSSAVERRPWMKIRSQFVWTLFRKKEEKSVFQVFLFQLGMTPVHIAARHGHSSVITEFVKQGISLRNLSRKTGMTVHDAEAKDDDSSTYSVIH